MGLRENTTLRTSIIPIIGMAFLWPSLHASPYYPLSLTSAFSENGLAEISAYHIVYSLLLICILTIIIVAQKHITTFFAHSRQIALAGGGAGFFGSALLIISGNLGEAQTIVIGIGFMLIVFYVAIFVVGWLTAMAQKPASQIATQIALSYCTFSAIWLVLIILDIDIGNIMAICPVVSSLCLAGVRPMGKEPSSYRASSLKALPLGIVILCITFVYFGVISVRALTTMQQGAEAAGALSSMHHIVTAITSFLTCLFIALFYQRREVSLNSLLTVFAILVLIYMAALLMVMVGPTSDTLTMLGKRTLVAAEHCLEIFMAIIAVFNVSKKRLSPLLVFGLYAILIFVIPQLISLDLMYRSGLLEALAHIDLVLPLAAAMSFAVAAVSIGLLTSYSSRIAKESAERKENWQVELCRKAVETIEVSPREFDVIVLTYRGYSARKISEILLVSESTVKTHVSHAYRKLDIHSKQELIEIVDSYREDFEPIRRSQT